MYIIFVILGKVKVKDSFHVIHINPSCSHISGYQNLRVAVAEMIHNPVALHLFHISVESFRKVTPALQCVGQFIHHPFGIAEHKGKFGIIDIQKPAQDFYFIFALNIIIILFDVRNRQLFFYYFNGHCVFLVFFGNIQNGFRHGCRKQHRLPLLRDIFQNCLYVLPKSHVQHFVRLIQYDGIYFLALDGSAPQVIHNSSWCSDDDLSAAF